MQASIWWLYDLLVIGVFVYVIISNARRGLAKVLVISIGYAVVTIAAGLFASAGAPNLYYSVASKTNISNFETANRHMDFIKVYTDCLNRGNYSADFDDKEIERRVRDARNRDLSESLYEYVVDKTKSEDIPEESFRASLLNAFIREYGEELDERLPHYVRMNFVNRVREDPNLMNQTVADFYNPKINSMECAEKEEKMFGEETTIEVLRLFLFFILFSVMMVVAALISAITQKSIFINIRKGADHALGGLIGIFEAGAMLILLTLMIRLIILLSGGGGRYINETEIKASAIFSLLYNNIRMLV